MQVLMKLIKKLLLSFYESNAYGFFKFILIKLFSEQRYNRLKEGFKRNFIRIKKIQNKNEKKINKSEIKFGVNVVGFLDSGLGLGEAARNVIKAVKAQKIDFVLNNQIIKKSRSVDHQYSSNFTNQNPFFFNLININPDYLDLFYLKVKKEFFESKYNIGTWYWELADIPKEWIKYYNFFNEIWVATDFVLNTVTFLSPVPVIKIPTIVDLNFNLKIGRDHFNIPENPFIYLFVFDFFSTMMRKNPISLVKSFKSAFRDNDDVILILKTINGEHLKKDNNALIKEIGDSKNIMIIDGFMERDILISLINNSNCYVSLHRSEGFGLGIAEAMYFGKPVIVTGYSGNMDFTNVNNSFLVKYKLIEIEEDHGLYTKGNIWAEPDLDHASQLMRYVFENREDANAVARKGEEFIKKNYNAQAVGGKIKNRLDFIMSE